VSRTWFKRNGAGIRIAPELDEQQAPCRPADARSLPLRSEHLGRCSAKDVFDVVTTEAELSSVAERGDEFAVPL
jgi:hypothetical protein